MPEENLNNVSGEAVEMGAEDYVTTIKSLKENSVPKADYEKLKKDNSLLMKALANGEGIGQEEVKQEIDVDALRADLFNRDHNNLEFVSEALTLRKSIMDKGGADPFVPQGSNIIATDDDFRQAAKVADALQECVDYADGNSAIFTSELQRIMKDTAPLRRGK